MFRAFTPITRSTRPCIAAYGFLHPALLPGGGRESRCVGRVYGVEGAARAAALRTSARQQGWVQKTVSCNTRSSAPDDGRKRPKHVALKNINKLHLLHLVDLTHYFIIRMHGQTNFKFIPLLCH
jgi:hypothetical protein